MKKISKYFLLVAIIMFIGLARVKASMTYTIYECSPGLGLNSSSELESNRIFYHLANHEPDPACQFNIEITLNSYTSGEVTKYEKYEHYVRVGGERGEDLNNADSFTDHYPKFIIITEGFWGGTDWYGADNLGIARSTYASNSYPVAIFISNSYKSELQLNAGNFNTGVSKSCSYEQNNITLNFNKEGYYIGGAGYFGTQNSFTKRIVQLGTEFVEQPHLEIQSDRCPKLYLCYNAPVYTIFSDSTQAVNKCEGKNVEKKWTTEGTGACGTYVLMKQQMSTYYSSDKTQYNRLKDELSNLCKGVISQSNYVNNDNFVDPCVTSCLDLNKDIAAIEGKPVGTNSCGFSEKLLAWIMNILRWVKYIVPVLLIILSILDFIKAMAGEKDDELKKAQKRFVMRLVAAVLIFIAPIIIEFVLGKMGFSAEDCGISNLGLGK